MFDLVLDVERYREFVPFDFDARVVARGSDKIRCRQNLRAGPFRVEFDTETRYHRPDWIRVCSEGPLFRHFTIDWAFVNATAGCDIHVRVDCLPRSLPLIAILTPWINGFASGLVAAFERRAGDMYGALHR